MIENRAAQRLRSLSPNCRALLSLERGQECLLNDVIDLAKVENLDPRVKSPLVHMTISESEDKQNSFRDLVRLSHFIYSAAGFRDQYEGLVLLRLSPLSDDRLQALGEGVSLWCKRAKTIFYTIGASRDEVLRIANFLDMDGSLHVIGALSFQEQESTLSTDLHSQVSAHGLTFDPAAMRILQEHVEPLAADPSFSTKMLAANLATFVCPKTKISTDDMNEFLNNPFTYPARCKFARRSSARKPLIGFSSDR